MSTSAAPQALDRLQRALDALNAAPTDRVALEHVAQSARLAAQAIAALPRGQTTADISEPVRVLAKRLRDARVFELAGGEPAKLAPESRGLSGALARLLAGPTWKFENAPTLGEVPEALWGDYAAWIFAAPISFVSDGEAERFAEHFAQHAEELSRWVERNFAASAVRAALESYLASVQALPLAAGTAGLKRQAEAHGRILAAASGSRRFSLPTSAVEGRKLRVAFIASHESALPACYRMLDAARFEVTAYALEEAAPDAAGADTAVSAILSLLRSDHRTQKCRVLPLSISEQMATLAEARLDVIAYAEELALSSGALTQLAAQRLAPLQVALAPISVSTGLPSIDLIAVGEAVATASLNAQFSERLGLLAGAGYPLAELPEAQANAAAARAALPIPENACVVMTAARLTEITPARMAQWTELLRQVPETILAIQLLQAAELPAGAIEALGAEWDARLAAAGVAPQRGLILAAAIQSISDLQGVVAAADLFLDAGAFAEPDLLHVPLALGVPVLTTEGSALRGKLGAGLLRSLGLTECVGRDTAQAVELAVALARDPAKRRQLGAQARERLVQGPLCRDVLAASEVTGELLLAAYEDLHALGPRKFRAAAPLAVAIRGTVNRVEALERGSAALANRDANEALRQARAVLRSNPTDAAARHLAGQALLAQENFAAAVDYLLAAVQTVDGAAIWFDLAKALRGNGQPKEAIQALETSLRHDPRAVDSWVMLIELAREAGAIEIGVDALDALRAIAPNDPRLAALERRKSRS